MNHERKAKNHASKKNFGYSGTITSINNKCPKEADRQ